jgi:Flp pilus assembly protein CpaB
MKTIKTLGLAVVMMVSAAAAFAGELNVPAGYRAVVVEANKAEMLFIKPGDRLDMTVTFEAQMADNRKETVTASILQNVLVLDTVDKDGLHAVLLALNPNEAQYAMLCENPGYRIDFTIRGKGDTELHPMEMASFQKLFSGPGDKPAPKDEPAKAQ